MFLTLSQPRIIVICLGIGVFSGIIYDIIFFFTEYFDNKIINFIKDIVYFILTAFLFTFISTLANLGNFRFYMALLVSLGAYLYIKTFHKIIAKIYIKVYNIINKLLIKVKNARRKEKKGAFRCNEWASNVTSYTNNDKRLSNSRHRKKIQQNKSIKRRNSLFRTTVTKY